MTPTSLQVTGKMFGGALDIAAFIIVNGTDDSNSKPGWGCLHFTLH